MTDDAGASATAVVLLAATIVMGAAGISIDLWRGLAAHRDLVSLADGAAAASATALDIAAIYADPTDLVLDPDEARRRACDHLAGREPILRCGGRAIVTVGRQQVTVALQTDVSLTLLRILTGDATGGPLTIRAESTVVAIRSEPPP